MKRLVVMGACAAALAAIAAQAGTNPAGRPTGLERAQTRMNAQGLAHQQATLRATNPATRGLGATRATPAIPATPATPATPGSSSGPAIPATPATPATPAVPATPPTEPTPPEPGS